VARDAEITLNVIYLEGSVRALHLGALSLAHYSPFRLRLVSNGCSEEEERLLASLCDAHPKLSFLRLPVEALVAPGERAPVPHGTALDHLQEIESSPFFGFVDSDVFAVGEFALDVDFEGASLFSALPVTTAWTRRHERFQREKNAVGSSYLAIYRNDLLSELRREMQWGFEICKWKRLPEAVSQRFGREGKQRKKYDTGKILNTWLALEGRPVAWVDDRNLRHLGGYSHPTPAVPAPSAAAQLPRYVVEKLKRHANDYRRGSVFLERKRFYRTACAEHFARVFDALEQGEPLPTPPRLRNRYIRRKLRETSEELQKLHALLGPAR
jgi:hypothetical protein